MTSIAVTSTITPRERERTTCCSSAVRRCTRSASVSAAWIVAMRTSPCLRIGTSTMALRLGSFHQGHDLVTQQAFCLFNASLQVAYRVHLSQIYANVDQRLC